MDKEYLDLMADLHKVQDRQGPGGRAETELALQLANIDRLRRLKIADIGCGTGASALHLARSLNAEINAVDLLPAFIAALERNAEAEGLDDKIKPHIGTMDELPFADAALDVIWSEGAIYNIGFRNGVTAWRRFLKPGGILVVSEITWTTGVRPSELETYWTAAYAEIATASSKLKVLEDAGYAPMGYFALPERCWVENYYRPLQDQLPRFLARHEGNPTARAIAEAEEREIAFYLKHKAHYGYGMYVGRKADD